MTAYIDNIIIQGTPEEIQEFIELRKPKKIGDVMLSGSSITPCPICQQNPCGCTNTGKFSKDYTTTT